MIISCQLTDKAQFLYIWTVATGYCASALYLLAFYYYFGRRTLVQCEPSAWVESDPRNVFLFWSFLGSALHTLEGVIFFWLEAVKS